MEHYSADEILAMERDLYAFQTVHDPEVNSGHVLLLETTIKEWRTIRDLVHPTALAKGYADFFGLQGHEQGLTKLLHSEYETTLGEFCNYIAENAEKEPITPVKLFGSNCKLIGLFRAFESRLRVRGVDTTDLKPSSEFIPFFERHSAEVVEVVAKLAPGTLRDYKLRKGDSGFLRIFFNHPQLSINGLQTVKDLIKAMSVQQE